MSGNNLKTHYSAKELLQLSLSCLPNSVQGIIYQAKKQLWTARKRVARGGGVEYALTSLPQAIQTEIQTKLAKALIGKKPQVPTTNVKEINLDNITDKQRQIADARMAIVCHILQLETVMSRIKAITHFCELAKNHQLSPELTALIQVANAKRSVKRTVSPRTLNQWVLDYCKAENAEQRLKNAIPSQRQQDPIENIPWLSWFLGIYRQTAGFSLTESYAQFRLEWQTRYADMPELLENIPHISNVRRQLAKLPVHIVQQGRLTGSKYKQLLPYVARDWSLFVANDIWIGDGHSLKMKVAHPIHGKPFTPELTMIVDGASRKIVGWSLALSESGFAVLDALRYAIQQHGVPAIYYSDNGGGETNKLLDAEITGILPRFAIHHETGIAGNPQGRGIIERLNKTVGFRIAQQFDTFYGKQADPETTRKMLAGQLALRNAKQGALTPKQKKAQQQLPSWEQLKDTIAQVIDWYNNQHIHRETKQTPAKKYRTLATQADILMLSEIELRDIARPQFKRKTQRGLIEWHNHKYFQLDLLNYQGQDILVGIDIHNANFVQCRTLDGRFICNAEFEANKRAAFPMSLVEQKREERAKGRLKRLEQQRQEVKAELEPMITITDQANYDLLQGLRTKSINKAKTAEPIAVFECELRRQQA